MKSFYYVALKICSILILVKCISGGHILVAGNEAAFKSLAYKFGPQRLAARLANIVSDATEASSQAMQPPPAPVEMQAPPAPEQMPGMIPQGEEYYEAPVDPRVQSAQEAVYEGPQESKAFAGQGDEYEVQADYGGMMEQEGENPQTEVENVQQRPNFPPEIQGQPGGVARGVVLQQTPALKVRTLQVNLEELVEKVKARLMQDLRTTRSLSIDNAHVKAEKLMNINNEHLRQDHRDLRNDKSQELLQQLANQQKMTVKTATEAFLVNRPKNIPRQKSKHSQPLKAIESHALYDKVKLNKKKDSYEEYITPQRGSDIFISEERHNNNDDKRVAPRETNNRTVHFINKKSDNFKNIATTKQFAPNNQNNHGRHHYNYDNDYNDDPRNHKNRNNNDYDARNIKHNNDYDNRNPNAKFNIRPDNNDNKKHTNDYDNRNPNVKFNNRPDNNNNKKNTNDYDNQNENTKYIDYEIRNNNYNKNVNVKDVAKVLLSSKDKGENIDNFEEKQNSDKNVNHNRQKVEKGLGKRPSDSPIVHIDNHKSVYIKNYNKGSKHDMSYRDYEEVTRNQKRVTPRKRKENSRVEYVDDEFRTVPSTMETEPKAMTEFIGGPDYNYNDEQPPTYTTDRTPKGYVNTKRKFKQIATNMPTRKRYTISTPNYYGKLPRIAEKYNFDEPIPERDRMTENLKPIAANNAAIINGKVRI